MFVLKYVGRDGWTRPVYENGGILYVDRKPFSYREPMMYTKKNNEIYGDLDAPFETDEELSFEPERVVWK